MTATQSTSEATIQRLTSEIEVCSANRPISFTQMARLQALGKLVVAGEDQCTALKAALDAKSTIVTCNHEGVDEQLAQFQQQATLHQSVYEWGF